jgi:hypothetical protein
MDTCDVSSFDKYINLMKRQQEVLQAARKRSGECPRDRRSRLQLVERFMMQHMLDQLRISDKRETHDLHSTFVSSPYLPSIAPLKDLKKLFIQDLRLETHHSGTYILLRSITPPTRMTAIMSIMEDEKEEAIMLQVYQQAEEKERPVADILKEKDIVLIKEPYFKIMGDGEYGLRVDHVSDIMWIEAGDERVPLPWYPQIKDSDKTANDWKLEGNENMKRDKYWSAIHRYAFEVVYGPDCSHMV